MLLNLRFNETVAKFANAAGVGTADHLRLSAQAKPKAGGGACTSIAFRTGVSYLPLPRLHVGVERGCYGLACCANLTGLSASAQEVLAGLKQFFVMVRWQ